MGTFDNPPMGSSLADMVYLYRFKQNASKAFRAIGIGYVMFVRSTLNFTKTSTLTLPTDTSDMMSLSTSDRQL